MINYYNLHAAVNEIMNDGSFRVFEMEKTKPIKQ